MKQTALKSGYNFTTYGKFTDTSWIEELQIGPLAQHLGSDKQRVLSPYITNVLRAKSLNYGHEN